MNLTVYNGEQFIRSKLRFIIFFIIVWAVVVASFLSKNWIGAIIVLIFVGGYFFFLNKMDKDIIIKIEENWLFIDEKCYERNNFSGFVLEYHVEKEQIQNIVFLSNKGTLIFTLHDTPEHLETFIQNLVKIGELPQKDNYEQTLWEKLCRKLKL